MRTPLPRAALLRAAGSRCAALVRRTHRDQRGSISIVSVFALLLIVMLLGMVMNVGRQVDQKVKMQNAADAAVHAGGVVLARDMNTLAFTNHLLCDVFALTAFMREGRAQSARSFTPQILDNWERIAPVLTPSDYPKFADLGLAVAEKVPAERERVRSYSEWSAAAAELMLPVLEDILANRRIPEFQRALVRTSPQRVQGAADEIARRHGAAWPRATRLYAAIWRTSGDLVGGVSETERRTLPVVDPVMDPVVGQQQYRSEASQQRRRLAHRYLRAWNSDMLRSFDRYGKMSQFANLWRIFTCGELERLLNDEYPDTNLPHLIRTTAAQIDNMNLHLEQDFMFVGVVYRDRIADRMPGVFKNPVATDTIAYAQTMLFVPRRRLVWMWRGGEPPPPLIGGVPGQNMVDPAYESDPRDEPPGGFDVSRWVVGRQPRSRHPENWDLWNQNWTTQLTPATAERIPLILSSPPYGGGAPAVDLADLRRLSWQDFRWVSHH